MCHQLFFVFGLFIFQLLFSSVAEATDGPPLGSKSKGAFSARDEHTHFHTLPTLPPPYVWNIFSSGSLWTEVDHRVCTHRFDRLEGEKDGRVLVFTLQNCSLNETVRRYECHWLHQDYIYDGEWCLDKATGWAILSRNTEDSFVLWSESETYKFKLSEKDDISPTVPSESTVGKACKTSQDCGDENKHFCDQGTKKKNIDQCKTKSCSQEENECIGRVSNPSAFRVCIQNVIACWNRCEETNAQAFCAAR